MQKSEFYYGLPQNQWDILLAEAEDLLRDEDIGTHLVGLYPAGNRIYGIESESPGILCLYVDTVESLINPIYRSGNPTGFRTIYHGSARSPIIFANLFEWVQQIIYSKCGWQNKSWLHMLPFTQLIYQDNSIDGILELTYQYQSNLKFYLRQGCISSKDHITEFLYHRADAILTTTGKLHPCINPEWGKVATLDCIDKVAWYVKSTDSRVRNYLLGRGSQPNLTDIQNATSWLEMYTNFKRDGVVANKALAEQIGQEVANLYRSLI
jgi:hypothetical protein